MPTSDEWASRDVPVKEDMPYQQKMWRLQLFSWLVLLALLLAALLGVFSVGPLSSARAEADGISIRYERFLRSAATIPFAVDLAASPDEERSVLLGASLLEALTLETVRPDPARTELTAEGVRLVFSVAGGAPATIHLDVRPKRMGLAQGRIAADPGGAGAEIWLFVYP